MTYKTRAHQLRSEIREALSLLPDTVPLGVKRRLSKAMRECALIGACAERDRTLAMVRSNLQFAIADAITAKSIKDVFKETTL